MPDVVGHVLDLAALEDAGVGHHHVEVTEPVHHRAHQLGDLLVVGHVGDVRMPALVSGHGLVERLLPAACGHDGGAVVEKRPRDRAPDAGAPAGDDNDFVFEMIGVAGHGISFALPLRNPIPNSPQASQHPT